ncbi:hypothetical protein Pelo_17973 [Pelomyxa schiedti]|nr:hypothetical protein Pelo_17973 [Pelomyxa schiedti]
MTQRRTAGTSIPSRQQLKNVVMHRDHESHSLRQEPAIKSYNPGIVTFAYPYEIAQYNHHSKSRLLTCVPNALPELFYKPIADNLLEPREIKFLVAGYMACWLYPLRCRFKDIVEQKLVPGDVRSHPGYVSGNLESVQRQTQQYAEHLQRARIVGFGSHLGYQLSKSVEVTLAGGLIVGEVPWQDEAFWRQIVVEVYGSMSVEEIVRTINWWLEHDDEKDSEGRQGTGTSWCKIHQAMVDLILEQHNMYRDGVVGCTARISL